MTQKLIFKCTKKSDCTESYTMINEIRLSQQEFQEHVDTIRPYLHVRRYDDKYTVTSYYKQYIIKFFEGLWFVTELYGYYLDVSLKGRNGELFKKNIRANTILGGQSPQWTRYFGDSLHDCLEYLKYNGYECVIE